MNPTIRSLYISAAAGVSALGVLLAAPIPAQALTFNYFTNLTSSLPDGTPPWLRVLFEDFAPDVVHVTIEGLFNPASSLNFASEIGFNITNDSHTYLSALVAGATCAPLAGTTSCTTSNAGVLVGTTDGISVNNWKGFDLAFLLPPPKGGAGNTVGTPPDSVKYSLTAQGLVSSMFDTTSEPRPGDAIYYTVAKVQEVNNGQSTSISGEPGRFPPPPPPPPVDSVPGPLPLLGVLSAFGFSRKLRQRMRAA